MTKQEQATKIVAENTSKTRKEIIAIIRQELNMTDAGASTYYYNATKKLPAIAKTQAALREIAKEDNVPAPMAAKVASHWSDQWEIDNKIARDKVNQFLADIDMTELPVFLRK